MDLSQNGHRSYTSPTDRILYRIVSFTCSTTQGSLTLENTLTYGTYVHVLESISGQMEYAISTDPTFSFKILNNRAFEIEIYYLLRFNISLIENVKSYNKTYYNQ